MALSRGVEGAGWPSRLGGRTMRTVSFLGSLIGFSNLGKILRRLGFVYMEREGTESMSKARTVSMPRCVPIPLLTVRLVPMS